MATYRMYDTLCICAVKQPVRSAQSVMEVFDATFLVTSMLNA